MKKKIIVLSHKMSKEKWERIEFKYLKNCEVEIHDCSNFLLKNKNFNNEIELINYKKIVFKNLNSWKIYTNKLVENLKKNKQKIFVIDTIGNFDNFGDRWVKLMTKIHSEHGSWDTRKGYTNIVFKEVA